MARRRLGIPLALAAVLAASSAGAVTLCAKKSGKLLVRDVCKKRERAAVPGAIAIVGPTGAAGPAGPPGPPGIIPHEVVDATGKQFGTLLSWDSGRAQVVAAVPGVDVPLQFNVADGRLVSVMAPVSVLWEATDCTGTPLIADAGGLVPQAHVVGTRAYFSRTLTATLPSMSVEYVPSTPGDCGANTDTGRQTCCFNSSGNQLVAPAEAFDVSVLGVTPPLSVVPR